VWCSRPLDRERWVREPCEPVGARAESSFEFSIALYAFLPGPAVDHLGPRNRLFSLISSAKCRAFLRVQQSATALDLVDDQIARVLSVAGRVGRRRYLQALLHHSPGACRTSGGGTGLFGLVPRRRFLLLSSSLAAQQSSRNAEKQHGPAATLFEEAHRSFQGRQSGLFHRVTAFRQQADSSETRLPNSSASATPAMEKSANPPASNDSGMNVR
jgi:hypothetical protein